jgi:hypothetical protein
MSAYRATGADPPFGDPRRAHDGVAMEGYFWRFSHAATGRVVVALCGVNRAADGHWATVALAGHPGGFLREAAVMAASADPRRLGATAGDVFSGDPDRVRVDLGADARLDVTLHELGGRVEGRATLGDDAIDLAGFDVYAEKNWGRGGFPERWWWGQAQGFDRPDVCVAFAGGDVALGPVARGRMTASALVVRLDDQLIRLGQPLLSPVRADVAAGRWHLRARGPMWQVEVTATAADGAEHVLPVPLPEQRRNVGAARQHLAGRLEVEVRRRGRLVYAGASALAGLERGDLGRPRAALAAAERPDPHASRTPDGG